MAVRGGVDPSLGLKSRASFIRETQKYWDKRLKEKEDNNHAALVERRVNSLLDQGWSFEDISSDTGLGTDSIRQFVDLSRPGYGVKEPGKSIASQVGDFSQAVVDRVGGGIVRGGIRLGALVAEPLPGEQRKAAEEFIGKYAENTPGSAFEYDESSTGGKIGRTVGTGIKAGVDIASISKAGSATRAATSGALGASKAAKVGSFVAGSGAETAAYSGIVTGQGNDVNLPREAGVGLLVDVATRGLGKGVKSIWARRSGDAAGVITDEARLLPELAFPDVASFTGKDAIISNADPKLIQKLAKIEKKISGLQQGKSSIDAVSARKLMRERASAIRAIQNPGLEQTAKAGRDFIATEVPKEAGRVRRAYMTTKGQLSRFGRAGKELSSRLDEAEFVSETAQGKWINQMPTVRKIGKSYRKKEFKKFVETLEALNSGKHVKMTPRIQQAVDEYTKVMPQILKEARDAGVDVAGDRGIYFFPKSYSQLKHTKGLNRAAKNLVDTGKAENLGDAIQQLKMMEGSIRSRPYGHLEMHRMLDLDEYDKTSKALFEYMGFSGNRIGRASMFGGGDEVAQQLIDEMGRAGHDIDRATKLYRVAQGDEVLGGLTRQKASSVARQFNTWRSLKKAAISNAGQTTNTATVAGWLNTAKGGLKSLSKKQRSFITETGVTADALISNMAQQHGISGLAGRVSAPAFGAVEKFNRTIAASAGDVWAAKLAKKGTPKAIKQLRKLGVTGDIGQVLTKKQRVQAARKLVERAQFKVGAKDLPAWAASPEGKLAIQFRSFTYKQSGFMYNEILKPLSQGDPRPLLRFSAALPVGFAVYKGKNMVGSSVEGGKDYSAEDEWTESVMGAYEALGAFGIGGDVKFAAEQFGKPGTSFEEGLAGTVGGPTGGFVAGTLFDIGDARSGQPTGLVRRGIESVAGPAGKAVANRIAPFPNRSLTASMGDQELANDIEKVSKEAGYNPRLPSKTQRGRELNDDEYERYANEYAALWASYYQRAIQIPGFNESTPLAKKKILSQVTRLAGSDARDRVLGEEGDNGRPKLPGDLEADRLLQTFKERTGQ
jgi:hypothetical protein